MRQVRHMSHKPVAEVSKSYPDEQCVSAIFLLKKQTEKLCNEQDTKNSDKLFLLLYMFCSAHLLDSNPFVTIFSSPNSGHHQLSFLSL